MNSTKTPDSKARQSRDRGDTKKILQYFQGRNPFSGRGTLRNLSSGRTADESVTVDMAKTLGQKILAKMTGLTVSDITFRKEGQAATLASKPAVSLDGDTINVDPILLR